MLGANAVANALETWLTAAVTVGPRWAEAHRSFMRS